MAKVTIPEGFIEVVPGRRGAAPRDFGEWLAPLAANGDQLSVLKRNGERYGSILAARQAVNAAIPTAEKLGFGLKIVAELVNATTKEAFLVVERVAKSDGLKYKAPKIKAATS